MPVHRVLTSDVEEATERIEKTERILSVVEAGDQGVLIFTEPKAKRATGGVETR